MKKKLVCTSDNKIFSREVELDVEQGQHQVGLYIGRRNFSKYGVLEVGLKISNEEFEQLVKSDKSIRKMYLTHHEEDRGLFNATWYFVMYEDRDSSYFKPTKLKVDYNKELVVEITVSFPDLPKYYSRVYEYKYSTDSNYPTTLNHVDVEEIFEEMIEKGLQGLSKAEDGYILAEMFDSVGSKYDLDISCVDELCSNVVGIRFV
jgi:hypothetical protein|nr:MAG TPA: hypothetical protein [Caudoviricetes sp.]